MKNLRLCDICGTDIHWRAKNAKYCKECAAKINRKYVKLWLRARRKREYELSIGKHGKEEDKYLVLKNNP